MTVNSVQILQVAQINISKMAIWSEKGPQFYIDVDPFWCMYPVDICISFLLSKLARKKIKEKSRVKITLKMSPCSDLWAGSAGRRVHAGWSFASLSTN